MEITLQTITQEQIQRFYSKISINLFDLHGCHKWIGVMGSENYGLFKVNCVNEKAHRVAFLLHYGYIERGKVIDHICRNTNCVNPHHLRLLSRVENIMIGNGCCAKNANKTHCKRGHLYTPETTRILRGGGRECKICKRIVQKRWEKRWGHI